ncbi:type II RES/Xre toxin-antitoxin system antitoxin [Chitinimonas lacunae]|uniref:Antitoxin Xre/MbcA/ParS toxin-binding domain-containing protein n=1 Tax=Chitinimonas lacunae TaxID=1963018 RepID=A0ABV8MMW6_9NEIS
MSAAAQRKPVSSQAFAPARELTNTPLAFVSEGPLSVIQHIRHGIAPGAVKTLADKLGMSKEQFVLTIGLPRSTIKARQTSGKPLSLSESERMVRVAKVLLRAIEVLEDASSASQWIKRPNRSLGGNSPLSLLDTEAGYELVMDILGRIEHGVVA